MGTEPLLALAVHFTWCLFFFPYFKLLCKYIELFATQNRLISGSFKTPEFDEKTEVLDSIAYVIGDPNTNVDFTEGKKKSGCLRRSFNGKPMGVRAVKKVLRHPAGSFAAFESMVRIALHNSIHNEIGK